MEAAANVWHSLQDIFYFGWRNLLEAFVTVVVGLLSLTVRQWEDWLQIGVLIVALVGGLYRLRLAHLQSKVFK